MKKLILTFCLLFWSAVGFCQDSLKTNPVLYMESYIGGSVLGAKGWNMGVSLNYQFKRNLITVKSSTIGDWSYNDNEKRSFVFFPFPALQNTYNEYAVLYGLRFIKEDHSLSFSIGLSQNYWNHYVHDEVNRQKFHSAYVGLPYEFTIKWFKEDKERYLIYGLIPIGKPTALGNSFGLKLYGNISKKSYAAVGIASSFGYHKRYY